MTTPPRKPIDVAAIKETETASSTADPKTVKEENDLDAQHRRAIIDGMRQDIEERKKYADRIFKLVAWWLGGMFLLLLYQGFLSPIGVFDLSEAVLLAAIGGTTVNVIGIFLIVANYLFPVKRPS